MGNEVGQGSSEKQGGSRKPWKKTGIVAEGEGLKSKEMEIKGKEEHTQLFTSSRLIHPLCFIPEEVIGIIPPTNTGEEKNPSLICNAVFTLPSLTFSA
ncbi:Hypothetical predicted protein [Podarcis lilfordi]|uniref:Uncharacterized protein n=1 Tax=Podarcis lilfordi TaxID=74358 RepID=A0AA35LFJ2_9SAUR|nr:Hypothetical predicted protein [Podarcis lilfordi]